MLSLSRPSEARIRAYLAQRQPLAYSYREVGATRGDAPAGYVVDHHRAPLGAGQLAYDRAREALRRWSMFRLGWVEVCSCDGPIQEGQVVGLLSHAYGIWCLFACKIVYLIDEHGPIERFGFAYGTLPGHMLSGEERFLIEWSRDDDRVWYDVLAYSRAARFVSKPVYRIVRGVQRRFAPESARAMQRAVNDIT